MMNSGVVFAILAGAIWGGVIIGPSLLPEFNAVLISSVRFALYGMISLLVALPFASRLLSRLTRRDVWMLLRLSLTGNVLNYALLGASVQLSGVTAAALINGMMPVAITFLGRSDAGSLPLTRLKLPLLLVFLGIVSVSLEHTGVQVESTSLSSRLLGLACGFSAVACWSWYATHNARYLKQSHFNSSEWSTLTGIVTGIVAIVFGIAALMLFPNLVPSEVESSRWTTFLWVCLFLALCGSWLANGLWNACSRRMPASLSGQMIVFETLFACVYGFLFSQRMPGLMEVVSIVLLVGGVVWAAKRHRIMPVKQAEPCE
ncbi:DMT family transporter [Pseudomonas laurylsulfatiphila]|uniref:EamA family transporter n=1 Tax=Pseudomonas laurylsulfatiphila TaxID=2011015 RepID=A0A2S6FPP5_9PSED|nr:DMT family transporter [Pseudomonas laurylsulfatiphila]PPK39454.1 EamA family transporter [Pseudomonas laurylsulfatiphila]